MGSITNWKTEGRFETSPFLGNHVIKSDILKLKMNRIATTLFRGSKKIAPKRNSSSLSLQSVGKPYVAMSAESKAMDAQFQHAIKAKEASETMMFRVAYAAMYAYFGYYFYQTLHRLDNMNRNLEASYGHKYTVTLEDVGLD